MDITFATYAASNKDLLCNYILASCIKEFAGNLSDIPLRIYVSSDVDAQNEIRRFSGLNVILSTYPKAKRFRYAFKSAAAKACEVDIKKGDVIWLDRHMLVLGSCAGLLLSPSEQFAYRPPHFKILGASVGEPINEMWQTAYRIAEIDESSLFPVYTEVDRQKIWAYFKGDHFSFRAEAGIMSKWDTLFNQLIEHKDMKPFLNKSSEDNETVRVYLHQIALTLAVLKNQSKDTLKMLPEFYGYPTDLHNKIDKNHQASQMDQLNTAYYNCCNGIKPAMPVSKQLATWLEDRLTQYR